MKMLNKILFATFSWLPILAFANTISVQNATGCLFNFDTMSYSYVQPVTIYDFVGSEGKLSYSGDAVEPGQTATVPMGISTSVQPNEPALFLGTSPGDAQPHITVNIPSKTETSALIVQVAGSSAACTVSYPCVLMAVSDPRSCITLLKNHQKK